MTYDIGTRVKILAASYAPQDYIGKVGYLGTERHIDGGVLVFWVLFTDGSLSKKFMVYEFEEDRDT